MKRRKEAYASFLCLQDDEVKIVHKHFIQLFIKEDTNYNPEQKRLAYGFMASVIGIVSNFILFLMKYILGYFTFSVAIKADAFNNLFDSLSSLISLFGFKLASKPADREHPFGHARFEMISDLFVGLIIAVFGFGFSVSSFEKVTGDSVIHISNITIVLLVLTSLVKVWQASFNRSIGKEISSQLLITTAQDSVNDVLINLSILIGLLIQNFFDVQVDGLIGLFLSLYIIYSGLKSVMDSIKELLGRRIDNDDLYLMAELLASYDNILGYHDLVVHRYGPNQIFATVHIEVDSKLELLEAHEIAEVIENDFLETLNINLVVHPDPVILDDPLVNSYLETVVKIVKSYDDQYSLHDFRLVKHHKYNIIVFDLVVKDNEVRSDYEIKEALKQLILEHYPNDKIDIIIDRNYLELEIEHE